jgi:hypothetical protein
VVAVLAGVGDGGDGLEGVLGHLGEHGGLLGGLVPQDFQAERGEQAGFEGGRQGGQDVPGEGELVEQGGVGGGRGGLGQGGELGFWIMTTSRGSRRWPGVLTGRWSRGSWSGWRRNSRPR